MNQGTQGYSLMKKTEGRKSHDTVPLRYQNNGPELCCYAQNNNILKITYEKMCLPIQRFSII
jgi:hypothetical protein